MHDLRMEWTRRLVVGCVLLVCCQLAIAQNPSGSAPAVTVTEDDANFMLANGTVSAVVAKATGDLISLQYKGLETIYSNNGRVVGANFTQNASTGTGVVTKITIDPKSNNGDRGEVSVKGINISSLNTDMEFRFCLERGESGIY